MDCKMAFLILEKKIVSHSIGLSDINQIKSEFFIIKYFYRISKITAQKSAQKVR